MGYFYIVRVFDREDIPDQVIKTGLTEEEAKQHCKDPETSSSTATSLEATLRTKNFGIWWDAYEEYKPKKEMVL